MNYRIELGLRDLRQALAAHIGKVRNTVIDPEAIEIGVRHGLFGIPVPCESLSVTVPTEAETAKVDPPGVAVMSTLTDGLLAGLNRDLDALDDANQVNRQPWSDFVEAGLLWWVNRILHTLGWSIVVSVDKDTREVREVYPARTSWLGFAPDVNAERFDAFLDGMDLRRWTRIDYPDRADLPERDVRVLIYVPTTDLTAVAYLMDDDVDGDITWMYDDKDVVTVYPVGEGETFVEVNPEAPSHWRPLPTTPA